MIWLPTVENVLLVHEKMLQATGGATGVRDIGLIESAVARADASFDGVEAHAGITAKAAAVGCGLTQNHGFVDGNKRVGMAVLLLILRRNGIRICYTQDELEQLGLAVAQDSMDVEKVTMWIEQHRNAART